MVSILLVLFQLCHAATLRGGQQLQSAPMSTVGVPPFIKLVSHFGAKSNGTVNGAVNGTVVSGSQMNVSFGSSTSPQCTCTFSGAEENACGCTKIREFLSCVRSACSSGQCSCPHENPEVHLCEQLDAVCGYVPLQCNAEGGPKCLVDDFVPGKARSCDLPWCKAGAKKAPAPPPMGPPGLEAIAKSMTLMECAAQTDRWLLALKKEPGTMPMPARITLSCSSSKVWKAFGGNYDTCHDLALELVEAYETSGEYFGLCRSIKSAGSDLLAKVNLRLQKDPMVQGLLDSCKVDCPYITKIVKTMALTSKMNELAFSPPEPGGEPIDYEELFGQLGNLNIQICDLHAKAVCKPDAMPKACTDLMAAVKVPQDILQMHWTRCVTRKPCLDACPGVDAKYEAFGKAMDPMMSAGIFPVAAAWQPMCKATDVMMGCLNQPKCTPYLNTLFSLSMQLKFNTKKCAYFNDACYEKQLDTCKDQAKALITYAGEPDFNMCPAVGSFPTTGGFYKPDAIMKCCELNTAMGKCNADIGCAGFYYNAEIKSDAGYEQGTTKNCPAFK